MRIIGERSISKKGKKKKTKEHCENEIAIRHTQHKNDAQPLRITNTTTDKKQQMNNPALDVNCVLIASTSRYYEV